jgi:long-subunit acyl-CoA synthetase (AMP-forming)
MSLQSWLPLDALKHCLINTQSKLIILDPERADCLEGVLKDLTDAGAVAFFVMECHEGKGEWSGMHNWHSAVAGFKGTDHEIIKHSPTILPEDNATIMFTSGKPVNSSTAYLLPFFPRYDWSTKRSTEYPADVSDECVERTYILN